MKNKVFLETSAWFAAMCPGRPMHRDASEAYKDLIHSGGTFITSNVIVAQTHGLVVTDFGVVSGRQFLESVYADATHRVRFVTRELEARATDRWLRPFDCAFTLSDAVCFEIMKQERIRRAFTLRQLFREAGFEMAP